MGTLAAIPILMATGAAGQVPTPEPSPSEPAAPPPPSPEAAPSPPPSPPETSTSDVVRQKGQTWNAAGDATPSRPGSTPRPRARQVQGDACARLSGVAAHGPGGDTTAVEAILARSGGSPRAGFLEAAGPFPVAGPTWWTNDWHVRRCEPYPHLHEGLDMFADAGTPVVAAADGRVNQSTTHAIAGLSVEIIDAEGVQYFYAHLSRIASGVSVGDRVEVGDVLGFVGATGNASGGSPHLHLEVQPSGVPVPPKPYVDRWLAIFERRARRVARADSGTSTFIHRAPREDGATPAGTIPRTWPALGLARGWHGSIQALAASILGTGIPLGIGLARRAGRRRRLAWRQLAQAVRMSTGR